MEHIFFEGVQQLTAQGKKKKNYEKSNSETVIKDNSAIAVWWMQTLKSVHTLVIPNGKQQLQQALIPAVAQVKAGNIHFYLNSRYLFTTNTSTRFHSWSVVSNTQTVGMFQKVLY